VFHEVDECECIVLGFLYRKRRLRAQKYSEWMFKRDWRKCFLSFKDNRKYVTSWSAIGVNLKRTVLSQGNQKYD